MTHQIKRGEIYYVELGKTIGSEQSGVRPSLIVQNDVGNLHSPTTQIIPLTITPQDIYQNTFRSYPDLLNVPQVSEILGVSTKTVYRLLQQNAFASLRVGREFRIPKIYLMQYVQIFEPHEEKVGLLEDF